MKDLNLQCSADLREAFGKVRHEQVGLVAFTLAMLNRFVVEERVQLHRLVRRRTVLVLRQEQSQCPQYSTALSTLGTVIVLQVNNIIEFRSALSLSVLL